MSEHKLTETFVLRTSVVDADRFRLVRGDTGVDAGTLADVAALGRALVAFAGGLTPTPAVTEPCTGIAASWCHNCGDCTCERDEETLEWGERDRKCQLHGDDSMHEQNADDAFHREAASASALAVGAALALPQVQDGTHMIEAIIGLIPEQWACRPDENGDAIVMARMWRPPARRWRPWSMMSPDGRQFLHTCRLVPIAEADADPATRGDL